MRCPLPWQLRLHWFVPAALLWAIVLPGLWLAWATEPARWIGTHPGIATSGGWQTPEQTMLNVSTAIAWIGSLGLAFTWLVRVRIHNRWRECAPAPRLGVWWEYLWGAAFFSLLFAPALALETFYPWGVQQRWDGTNVQASKQATSTVDALELLVDPRNAAALIEWTRTLDADIPKNDREGAYLPHQALRWLVQGDSEALVATLEQYGAALRAWGYTPVGNHSTREQAAALQAAYRAALQSPLALEWRNYRAQHPLGLGKDLPEQDDDNDTSDCRIPSWHHSSSDTAVPVDASHCFATYARMTDTQWRDMLQSISQRNLGLRGPLIVQWSHPRYGLALPQRLGSHLQHAERTDETPWKQRAVLLTAVFAGFFAALALVIARLMSPRQIAIWAAGLVLALPATFLLGMLGLADSITLPLIPTLLLVAAWVRIALLRRPWGGSLLLGLALVLGQMGNASLWDTITDWIHRGRHHVTHAPVDDATRWLDLLLGTPAIALSTAALVAFTAPLWRRWRGLPER